MAPFASPADHVRCQPCLVLSTGGTTGTPEEHRPLLGGARLCGEAIRGRDRFHRERRPRCVRALWPRGRLGLRGLYAAVDGASILPIARWRPQPVAEAIDAGVGRTSSRWGRTSSTCSTLDEQVARACARCGS